jgi:hemerythrin superfamily protein
MSGVVAVEVSSIRELIDRLIQEHRAYPSQVKALNDALATPENLERLSDHFVKLQDSLTEHMLNEEFEVYPELMKRGLFDETTSMIMQQHHDLTASLGKMELALRIRNLGEFRAALEELDKVLRVHQPAEEEKVFPQAV